MTTIATHKYEGIYYGSTRRTTEVTDLRSFIHDVRSAFEDSVDAVLILKDGVVTGLWLAEPDIDCDCDGFYEVAGRYPGDEYNLYRPNQRGFWNYVGYHFGPKYVPEGYGYTVKQHSKALVTA